MKAAVQDLATPARRIGWGPVLLLLAGHLFFILLLSQESSSTPALTQPPSRLHLWFEPAGNSAEPMFTNLSDPMLFARLDARGLSGSAWLRKRRLRYEPTREIAPPIWLRADTDGLGADFDALLSSMPEPVAFSRERLSPPLAQVSIPASARPVRPQLKVEGELAGRTLLTPFELATPDPATAWSNTTVRVLVNADGFAATAALTSRSGSDAADNLALRFARSARFEPLDPAAAPEEGAPLSTGHLVFQWFLPAPPPTNAVPSKPGL